MNETNRADMLAVLERQRTAFTAARPEALSVRHDRLERCATLLKEHGEAFAKAMSADFGHRSHEQSMLTDIMPSVSIVRYSQKRMKHWSRPEKRHVNFPLNLLGARAEVRYEPKGVIGIVAPWNFPVGLTMAPLAQAFAAGNRAMLKTSEFTERTSELMQELFPRYFAEEEVAVVRRSAGCRSITCCSPARRRSAATCSMPRPTTSFRSRWNWAASRRRSSAAARTSSAAPSGWRWAR